MRRTSEELLDRADSILEASDRAPITMAEQYSRKAIAYILLAQERRAQEDREEYARKRKVDASASVALYEAEHNVNE